MVKFLLWLILLVLCWPPARAPGPGALPGGLALSSAVPPAGDRRGGILGLFKAIITLPARVLGGPHRV